MRVLIGIDGSPSAERASALVGNLAWPLGTTIDVVTAFPGAGSLFGMPGIMVAPDVVQRIDDDMADEARRVAAAVARQLSTPDLEVETHVLLGRPASVILDQAQGLDADLIVLGNRGRGPFESEVLGSVSAEVVDANVRPVLVARRDRIRRILLAEDGSDSAATAANAIRLWPILHEGSVHVLSVADTDRGWGTWLRAIGGENLLDAGSARSREEYGALAGRTAARLRAAGLRADSEVQDGNPAHRLVEAAVNWDADLIVLGTHGHTRLERLVVGSVARAVLHHAPCSVLVVPEPAQVPAIAAAATHSA
jgi:nucleotide-binding universal stress UspA family protein